MKKRMIKNLVISALISVLPLTFIACGTETDSANTTTKVEEKEEVTTTETKVEEPVEETNPYKNPVILLNITNWLSEGAQYPQYISEVSDILVEYGSQDATMYIAGAKMVLEQTTLDEAIAHFSKYQTVELPQELKDANNYYLESFKAYKQSMEFISSGEVEKGTQKLIESSELMTKGTEKTNEANELLSSNK